MNKEPSVKGRAISLEELLVRAEEVKQYLTLLENRINDTMTRMTELQLAKTTLMELPDGGGEGYIVADRLSSTYIPVLLPEDWKDRILVNIGLTYYIKTGKDEAMSLIDKRLNDLRKISDLLNRQYRALLNEYNALQQLLSTIYAQMASRQQRQTG